MGKRGPKARLATNPTAGERPYAPRGLSPQEKAAWDSLCDDLEALKILARVDRKLIEIYARTHALWEKSCEEMSGKSLVIVGEKRDYVNPLVNLQLTLSARLRQILLDCGLSPSTRQPSADGGGEMAGLIGGAREGGL